MKNLITILFLFVFANNSNAQGLRIYNTRTCTIEIVVRGECPGGSCDGIAVNYRIPSGGFVNITSIATASSSPWFIAAGTCSAAAAFRWHSAEIQSIECACGGFGVAVGDGTCPHYITGAIYNKGPECQTITSSPEDPSCEGAMQCARWETFDGYVEITAF